MEQICATPERFADTAEFAYVENAAHFIADDAPEAVAELSLRWFQRTNLPGEDAS